MFSILDKANRDASPKKSLFLAKKLQYFPIYKQIHLTNFVRICGDFIISDDLHMKKYDLVHPMALIRQFKYIKQIHIRKNGIILEYDYIAEIIDFPIECISNAFDSLGIPFYNHFSNALREFHQFDLKQEKIKNEKIDEEPTLKYFDNIFLKHKNDRIICIGDEIMSKSDFSIKYYGFNNNMVNYISIDDDINYFSKEFISACEDLLTFLGSENYLFRIMEYFYNVMNKINSKNDINFPQMFKTFAGLHLSSMRIEEFFFSKENLMTFVLILENSEKEILFYNNILRAKSLKNQQVFGQDCAKKKIERHNELFRLYYHKKSKEKVEKT
jgi:hypothetical protein